MAINKNHEFEELDGIKCAIVEKNAGKARVDFLKPLLEFNKYQVVVVASPAPKPTAPVPAAPDGNAAPAPAMPAPAPESYTIGVTDVMFNPVNAIYGRLLRTPDGHVVTLAYWQQKENIAQDEIPYFEKRS